MAKVRFRLRAWGWIERKDACVEVQASTGCCERFLACWFQEVDELRGVSWALEYPSPKSPTELTTLKP